MELCHVNYNDMELCVKYIKEDNIFTLSKLQNASFKSIKDIQFIMDSNVSRLLITDDLDKKFLFTPRIYGETLIAKILSNMNEKEKGKLPFIHKPSSTDDMLFFINMALSVSHRKDDIQFDNDKFIFEVYNKAIVEINEKLFKIFSLLKEKVKDHNVGISNILK